MNTVFDVKKINFRWNKKNRLIIKDCSFKIKKGTLTSIIGINGSGKSTLIKLLANFIPVGSGNILFFNKEITNYKGKELAKRLSYVSQNPNENIPLTVNEIVKLGNYPYYNFFDSNFIEENKRLKFALEITEIGHLKHRFFDSLSGGEKQKVMVARAVCQSYEVLLLDEPTSSLDLKNKIEIMILLRKLVKEKQSTIIMISHDLSLIKIFLTVFFI